MGKRNWGGEHNVCHFEEKQAINPTNNPKERKIEKYHILHT